MGKIPHKNVRNDKFDRVVLLLAFRSIRLHSSAVSTKHNGTFCSGKIPHKNVRNDKFDSIMLSSAFIGVINVIGVIGVICVIGPVGLIGSSKIVLNHRRFQIQSNKIHPHHVNSP